MKYIFANWKMYLDFDESHMLVTSLVEQIKGNPNVEIALFPSMLSLADVREQTKNSLLKLGAQDVSSQSMGAYTGAVSALMCKNVGCTYALIGHSERRYIFGETNEDVRKKVEACLEVGLIPVVCIGETVEDKAENKRQYRLKKQLFHIFDGLEINARPLIIAYEPVWAISRTAGSEPCSPSDVEDVHGWIGEEIKQYTQESIPLIYGGSVEMKNVLSYTSLEAVQGVLVGGASTKKEALLPLIDAIGS